MKVLKNRIRRRLWLLAYSHGDRFHCVFCGKSYARFLGAGVRRDAFSRQDVVGAGPKRNARCPNCHSKDRARLLLLYLRERTELFRKPHRLLHIAPDPHLARVLHDAQTIDYVCGGLTNELVLEFDPLHIDVTAIPFEAEQFDVVLCNHVLSYVRDDDLALREIRRVLRPGGFALIQVPIGLALDRTYEVPGLEITGANTLAHYGLRWALRTYGRDYEQKLVRNGFEVRRHNAIRERWLPDIERHGLDPREELYVATRP